ncbi:MAG: hypothetical protein V4539_25030 [Bacteroidota bacterium]
MNRKIQAAGILLFLLMHSHSFSQNVDGHWYGVGIVQANAEYNNYMSELILKQKGKTVSGTLNYYFMDSLVKVNVNGSFDAQTRKLTLKPFLMIYYLSPNLKNSIDCTMSGDFVFMASKTETILLGGLVSDALHSRTTPPINFRFIHSSDTAKLITKDEPEEVEKDTTKVVVAVPKPVQVDEMFAQRSKVFTKELEVTGSTIRLELYDNGEIDGDAVSLYLNDKRILNNSVLSHKAIRLTVELDQDKEYNEISMFAENLGTIPPNTAALILYDGKTRHEIFLTSDLSKNATIKLKRKK